MRRITAKLAEEASPAIEFRQCQGCGMMVDHASDHRRGCRCRRTSLVRSVPKGFEHKTNSDLCASIAAGMVAAGIAARVEGVGTGWVWVERAD
jgi:hypothetical protein